jgi:hypothetical protein
VQTGAAHSGVVLRQGRQHLLQGGLLQVGLYKQGYPCNRPWRPKGSETSRLPKRARQSAHRRYTKIFICLNCNWVFVRWKWYYNKTQHTKIHIYHTKEHTTLKQNATYNATQTKKTHYTQRIQYKTKLSL